MKKTILLSLFLVSLIACSSDKNSETNDSSDENEFSGTQNKNLVDNVEVSGQIFGAVNQGVFLEAQTNKGVVTIANGVVSEDGRFHLKGNIQGMGIYQLRLGLMDNKVIPLTLEIGDKVSLKADYETFERLPVWSGTKWSEPINTYMSYYNDFATKQVELSKQSNLSQDQQIAAFLKLRIPVDEFAKKQILKDLTNPANIVLSTSLTPAMGFEYWDESCLPILKKLGIAYKEKYKESPIAESMLNQSKEIEKAYKDFQLSKSGEKLAPEIALKNPDGKIIKLSSLRGNVVLIDFWASWCGPCRRENPNVVNMYNKYKSKNFTVYSVSLDSDAEAWKRAIKSDGLIWPNHVSDLLKWETPLTQAYGFNSIPYTVLVGKDGKIIGTNLRGESLEQKLKEIL